MEPLYYIGLDVHKRKISYESSCPFPTPSKCSLLKRVSSVDYLSESTGRNDTTHQTSALALLHPSST